MELIDVIHKLLGPIEPVGETHTDERRFQNLETTITIVDKLLDDLNNVALEADSSEISVRTIGQRARNFLSGISYKFDKHLLKEKKIKIPIEGEIDARD